jgi:protein-L-isoaspartate(D-aspartate) O-methyltransferase
MHRRLLCAVLSLSLAATGCGAAPQASERRDDSRAGERAAMVDEQIAGRGIEDQNVLRAMRKVPRHEFVPADMLPFAYHDYPLPIGHDQTISQPFIVAFMAAALELKSSDRVLEVGTGSGYHAAVMAEIAREVYTVEIVPELAESAAATLERLGYANVKVRAGDGYDGWPEAAPFDAVVVTAAPDHIPEPLIQQLRVGGRMIIPVGDAFQELRLIRKTKDGVREESTIPVRFVPMTGKAQIKR